MEGGGVNAESMFINALVYTIGWSVFVPGFTLFIILFPWLGNWVIVYYCNKASWLTSLLRLWSSRCLIRWSNRITMPSFYHPPLQQEIWLSHWCYADFEADIVVTLRRRWGEPQWTRCWTLVVGSRVTYCLPEMSLRRLPVRRLRRKEWVRGGGVNWIIIVLKAQLAMIQ